MEKENLWKNISLGTVTLNVSSGKSSTKNTNGDYPIYGSTGIIGSSMKFDYHGRNILVARVGANAGKTNLVDGKYCVSDNTLIVSPNDRLDANFCFHQLCFIDLNRLVFGSGQPLITGSILKNIDFPLPPTLEEQKAISTALSNVDELINNLDQLITKKKAIKQGAMQQLLTPPHKGGKRLEGYTGEWEEKKLGDVCEIRKGQLITESTRVDGQIPVIAGGKKAAYYHSDANRFGKTITISGSGASAGYVAFHNYPIFASDCSTIEESKFYSIDFIFFFLKWRQNQIYYSQTGGAQPHIHPSDLYPILIYVPKIEEQKAIAKILSDMDEEIEQLESKKAKYQSIKQGMMQELLTGKTRLI